MFDETTRFYLNVISDSTLILTLGSTIFNLVIWANKVIFNKFCYPLMLSITVRTATSDLRSLATSSVANSSPPITHHSACRYYRLTGTSSRPIVYIKLYRMHTNINVNVHSCRPICNLKSILITYYYYYYYYSNYSRNPIITPVYIREPS